MLNITRLGVTPQSCCRKVLILVKLLMSLCMLGFLLVLFHWQWCLPRSAGDKKWALLARSVCGVSPTEMRLTSSNHKKYPVRWQGLRLENQIRAVLRPVYDCSHVCKWWCQRGSTLWTLGVCSENLLNSSDCLPELCELKCLLLQRHWDTFWNIPSVFFPEREFPYQVSYGAADFMEYDWNQPVKCLCMDIYSGWIWVLPLFVNEIVSLLMTWLSYLFNVCREKA